MNHPISKTLFLEYLFCPKNIWLKMHKPELLHKFVLSDFERHLAEQGNEVESCARNLFPKGILVSSYGEDACADTVRLMTGKTPTIFQSTFIVDGFIARNDMLSFDEKNNRWDLYEVKGTQSFKETGERDHVEDVGFQVSVLKRSNIPLGRYFLIHLHKEYVRQGELDIDQLFETEDITDKVLERLPEIEKQMEAAKYYLNQEAEPAGGCDCVYHGRSKHCSTFQYSNSHIPEYSIHDISGIREEKVTKMIEASIFELDDVPDDLLSEKQQNQVRAHMRQKPIIEMGNVKEDLSGLEFPLYFFDYEDFGPAIPIFNGFSPYKPIPFQFSLHILDSPDAKLRHIEFLHEDRTDPSMKVAELLNEHILPKGRVVAWSKSHEAKVNKEIGIRLPQYAKLFERINTQLYDLRDIFFKQYYIHPDFKGKTSIKKVLPVLAPHLRYDVLDIKEGGQAADAWWKMVSPATSLEESKKIAKDLKIYCGLDTFAMYEIWKHLNELIQ